MPQAINVILVDSNGEEFDINKNGLVKMTFDRYLGSPKDLESEILSQLDVTLFDKTGYEVLSKLQGSNSKLRLKYGFSDRMSPVYKISITKIRSTFNNLGCMVSLGAYGVRSKLKFSAEIYDAGTRVDDLLIAFAERNNWYIGEIISRSGSGRVMYENIDCKDIVLVEPLLKSADMTDIEFIEKELVPLCNRAVVIADDEYITELWDWKLFVLGATTHFTFLPINQGTQTLKQRVWVYSQGDTTSSEVISVTNDIDYSFLINGLYIKVPVEAYESVLVSDEQITKDLSQALFGNWNSIKAVLEEFGLPGIEADEIKFNVELVPFEEAGDETIENRIVNSLKNAIMAINSIELTVVGNPDIKATDLIDLTVMNRPSSSGIVHKNIVSGIWKVISIREEIGVSGYQTTLNLVRNTNQAFSITKSKSGYGWNSDELYDWNVEVKPSYLTTSLDLPGWEVGDPINYLEYNNSSLPDGWYTLSLGGGMYPGPVSKDFTDGINVIFANSISSTPIMKNTSIANQYRNYKYNPPMFSLDIYIKDGYFKIYEAGSTTIFQADYLDAAHMTLTRISS